MKRLLTTAILLAIHVDVFADKLPAPIQITPIDKAKDVSNDSVTLTWRNGATFSPIGYRVVVSENNRFTGYLNSQNICIDKTCILGVTNSPSITTYTTPLRLSGKVYYWKVQAISGKWSKVNTFKTVMPQPVPTISSVKADKQSIVVGGNITFTAVLNSNLPSGYSVKIDFGNGAQTMTVQGNGYGFTQSFNTIGTQNYSVGIYDVNGTLKSSLYDGSVQVTNKTTGYSKIANNGVGLNKRHKSPIGF